METARIDKWLWAARIFKTRSIAAQACKGGRVTINGAIAKPAHIVSAGDHVGVRKPPVAYTFEVIDPIQMRVGAAKVPLVMRNITPREQLDYLRMIREGRNAVRDRGMGRPTKKERREIDDYMHTAEFSGSDAGSLYYDSEDDDFDFNFDDLDTPDEQ